MKVECRRCKKEKEERARGLCGACYVRTGSLGTRDRYALPRYQRKSRRRRRCMMAGCEAVVRSKDLCQIHYLRAWRAVERTQMANKWRMIKPAGPARALDSLMEHQLRKIFMGI